MERSLSVNRLAWKLLRELVENSAFYGVKVGKARSGSIIVDAGIEVKGGFQAGKLITQICMGGCGNAEIICKRYGDFELPSMFIYTDHPTIATLGSQYAGWLINEDGYFAIGSGPGRALALKPKKIYDEIGYKDDFAKAVIVLETDKHPPLKLIERIARDCKVSPEDLAVILTPTTSVAGAIQVVGRIVETGIHKLRKVGLDPNVVLHAWGTAPIPPSHPKFAVAMARTNDAILYGGTAYYFISYSDEEKLKVFIEKSPSEASDDYGKPFIEIFKEAGYDFYKIDANLFAPAMITITNVETGNTFRSGRINLEALIKSFGMKPQQ